MSYGKPQLISPDKGEFVFFRVKSKLVVGLLLEILHISWTRSLATYTKVPWTRTRSPVDMYQESRGHVPGVPRTRKLLGDV